jgi:hypothetical protein
VSIGVAYSVCEFVWRMQWVCVCECMQVCGCISLWCVSECACFRCM